MIKISHHENLPTMEYRNSDYTDPLELFKKRKIDMRIGRGMEDTTKI